MRVNDTDILVMLKASLSQISQRRRDQGQPADRFLGLGSPVTGYPILASFAGVGLGELSPSVSTAAGNWWALQDLNLGPMDYESTALTAELRALQ